MALVSQGLTDREIADQLHLSHATIKFHLNNIGVKMGFRRRVLLARWWWENHEDHAV